MSRVYRSNVRAQAKRSSAIRRSRLPLSAFLVVVVSASVAAATAAPVQAAVGKRPPVPNEKSVPHRDFPLRAPVNPASPPGGALPDSAWPSPGDADVVVAAATPNATEAHTAGSLPISLKPKAVRGTSHVQTSGTTSSFHVHLADPGAASKAGVNGVFFVVTPKSSEAAATVELDYSSWQNAAGAGFGSRLRLVTLPSCAASAPDVPSCRVQTPLPGAVNDSKTRRLTADLPTHPGARTSTMVAQSSSIVLAAVADSSGPNGSFDATSLAPSGTWAVDQSSGTFGWTYPIGIPPAAAGADVAPNVTLAYNSSAVDGQTASTNSQSSWLGEGWDYSPGFIERSYRNCADDPAGTAAKTRDKCWSGQILTMYLGGKASSLVQDDKTQEWHSAQDDGSRVERLTGSGNGALDGEYWKVTTTDGIQYFFGRNGGPGRASQLATGSTWTVPVYGAHAGDPCNSTTGFAASSCSQAWRWNLDYVEDPHGNASLYYYTPETNFYGADDGTTGVAYTRGGYLNRIDYGLRDVNGSVYRTDAPDQVVFTTAERCLPRGGVTCDPAQFTKENAKSWPDTPQDQKCDAGASCSNHDPSFWSTKRLTNITTQYAAGPGYTKVDSYDFTQQFSTTGDPALWLSSIKRTGYSADGTAVTAPEVKFDGVLLDNRVLNYNNQPAMARWRLNKITLDTGAVLTVAYSAADCTASSVPADPTNDSRRCFPVHWTLPFTTDPVLDYFHKYVTTQVSVQEQNAISPTKVTAYEYIGAPAWHYDDNELVKPADRTYGQFRGYGEVDVRTGDVTHLSNGVADQRTLTKTTYFRGMDGDTLPHDGKRPATVTNSQSETVPDDPRFTGGPYEVRQYDTDGTTLLISTISNPEVLRTTATRARDGLPALTANQTGTAKKRMITALAVGGTRTATTVDSYDEIGRLIGQTSFGDGVPDLCETRYYADNKTSWIRNHPSEVIKSQQACPAPGVLPSPILSDVRNYFDGQSTLGTITGAGDSTRTDTAAKLDGGTPVFATTASATYDGSGRVLTQTDGRNRTTKIAYTPTDGGVLSQTATTNALNQTSKVIVDPRGKTTSSIDVAGLRTDAVYDALGRVVKLWRPGHAQATQDPSTTYDYLVRSTGPSVLTTKNLVDTGTTTHYVTTTTLFDSFGQTRQTQSEAEGGGRLVNDTLYDSHGWTVGAARYITDGAPGTTMLSVADEAVDDRTTITHDGAARPLVTTTFKGLTPTTTTKSVYAGDSTTTVPPPGGTTTTTVTDVRGQPVELRQYTTAPVISGNVVTGGSYQATTLHYTALGQRDLITDADGATWSFGYDLMGHQDSKSDPDTGRSTAVYDAAGQVSSSTDSRGQTLAYKYDDLGRKVAEYADSLTGAELASWVYDTLQAGKLSYSTRYTSTGNYLSGVTGYDGTGSPTGQIVRVPAGETGLGGTYTTGFSRTSTGQLTVVQPAAGGSLPAEGIVTSYDQLGNPTSTTGYNAYVTGTSYTPFAEPAQLTLGASNNQAWLTYHRDPGTRRLVETNFSAQQADAQVDDRTYAYDPVGHIVRSTDVRGPVGSATRTECFTYDPLQRLTAAWTATDDCAAAPTTAPGAANVGGAVPYWDSWSFSRAGLRKSQTQHALPGSTGGDSVTDYTYPVPTASQPHTLSSSSTKGPSGTTTSSFGYDPVGNTTRRTLPGGEQTLTWDKENQLESVTTAAGRTSYVTDADGNQLIRRDPKSVTLYLPGEELTRNTDTGAVTGTRYYSHGGMTVAVRVGGADPVYLVGDQHGTNQLAYELSGKPPIRRDFDPYGNQIGTAPGTSTWPETHGFLNAPVDAVTGLTDLGARKYDPVTGRFASVDPVLDAKNPQQLAGYIYAGNNPVTFSDPSGLNWFTDMLDGIGDAISSAWNAVWGGITKGWTQIIDGILNMATQGAQASGDPNLQSMGAGIRDQGHSAAQSMVEQFKTTVDAVIDNAKNDEKRAAEDIKNGNYIGAVGDAINPVIPIASTVRRAQQVYHDVKNGDYAAAGPDFLAMAESAAGVALAVVPMVKALPIGGLAEAEGAAVGRGLAEAKTAEPGGLVAGCMNSFVGSTEVLVQGDRKEPIKAVKVGDSVTTGVPGKVATEQHVVTAVHVTDADRDFVELVIGTPAGAREVTATAHHRFYDVSVGNWVDAGDLRAGEQLDTPGEGRATVIAVRHFVASLRTYNLTVDSIHTYYVVAGETPVLVHNVGECPVNGLPHGKLGEAGTLDRLIREGYTNITPEVRFKNSRGVGFRADFVAQHPDGRWVAVEVKTGGGAQITPGQAAGYPELTSVGATLDTSKLSRFDMLSGDLVQMDLEIDAWECPTCHP